MFPLGHAGSCGREWIREDHIDPHARRAVGPANGEIQLDGKTWEQLDDQLVRGSIAYAPQQVFVFNASIRDMITLWNPGYRSRSAGRAADAQFLETVTGHPDGFQRQLRDNGSDLSGGERQRLVCRALIRRPSILLLDEATSSLANLVSAGFSMPFSSGGSRW